MGKVANLFRATKRREPMEELSEAVVLADMGFEGCSHARPRSKRQVLLADLETLDVMNLSPGIIRENITTEGIDVNRLRVGQCLRVGTVRLEVGMVCAPCELMEKIRPGLQKELVGRRGMLCRVIEGGSIRRGDPIEEIDWKRLSRVGTRFTAQRRSFGRAILVLFRLFDRLIGRDNPLEAALLLNRAEDERCIRRDQRERRAEKIGGISGDCLLRLAFIDGLQHFCEARLPGTQSRNARIIPLD